MEIKTNLSIETNRTNLPRFWTTSKSWAFFTFVTTNSLEDPRQCGHTFLTLFSLSNQESPTYSFSWKSKMMKQKSFCSLYSQAFVGPLLFFDRHLSSSRVSSSDSPIKRSATFSSAFLVLPFVIILQLLLCYFQVREKDAGKMPLTLFHLFKSVSPWEFERHRTTGNWRKRSQRSLQSNILTTHEKKDRRQTWYQTQSSMTLSLSKRGAYMYCISRLQDMISV